MLIYISILALLPTLTWGTNSTLQNGNMTVAFFGDKDAASCDENDISKALVMTTQTVPYSFTCFNLADLFSQKNTSGSTNGEDGYSTPESLPLPNYINWTISNLDRYDPNAVYSHVWYNDRPGTEEGVDAPWTFYVYAFADCVQNGGDDYELETWPWFETSCTTKEGGQCRTLPNSIKSFAINKAVNYNKAHGGCETWAKMGAAPRSERWSIGLVSLSVCAVVFSLF